MALRGTFAFHSVKRSSEAVHVVKEVVFRKKHAKAISCLRFFDRTGSVCPQGPKDLRLKRGLTSSRLRLTQAAVLGGAKWC